jgi:hypothetical protein
MVNFRRTPEPPPHQADVSVDPADDQPTQNEPATTAVARTSRYSLRENVDERDAVGEAPGAHVGMEEAKAVDGQEGAEVAAVSEEIQMILVSAQDAAVKIRRRAEQEAERIRKEAASTAAVGVDEAQRIAEADRMEAGRIRAEAEAYATETRAAAHAAAEQRRIQAEGETAQMLAEAQRRRDAVDAELAHKVEHAEAEARQRVEALQAELERQEQRLERMIVLLHGMGSQLEALLGPHHASEDLTHALANEARR